MQILDRYIGRQVIKTVLIVSLALLGIDLFLYLVNEIRYAGQGEYDMPTIFLYIFLTIPRKLNTMFPWAALVGTLMALGQLATKSELVLMRTSGVSVSRIAISVLKAGIILLFWVLILSEGIAPYSEDLAQETRTRALSGGKTIQTQYGMWVRNGNEYVHVKRMEDNGRLVGVTRYRFSGKDKLEEISTADVAYPVEQRWRLERVHGTQFKDGETSPVRYDALEIKKLLDLPILEMYGVKHLERLSIFQLWQAIQISQDNELNDEKYAMALWAKIFQPLTVITMVFLAIPAVFGPLRSTTMSVKLMVGIAIGFLFYTLNSAFASFVVVYEWPPFLAAGFPTMVFFAFGYWMMQKVR